MKIATSITIDENLIEKLDTRAEKEGRTRSNMIEMILKEILYNQENDNSEK